MGSELSHVMQGTIHSSALGRRETSSANNTTAHTPRVVNKQDTTQTDSTTKTLQAAGSCDHSTTALDSQQIIMLILWIYLVEELDTKNKPTAVKFARS